MLGVDQDCLEFALGALRAGQPVALVTVVRTFGSAPRPVGSLLAVSAGGASRGSVSGGCVDEELVRVLGRGPPVRPECLTYGQSSHHGLPCGGVLELLVEPVHEAASLAPALEALRRRERLARRLELSSGRVSFGPARPGERTGLVAGTLVQVFGPAWRLLAVGAGQTADHLASMARALDYDVLLCEPRPEWREAAHASGARLTERMPDEAVRELSPDPCTAVVTLSHDPKLDDLALIEALPSAAFYVGALGSRASNERRRGRLAEHFGLDADCLARLRGPVGLDLGGRTPPEIALAIMADLTARRHGRRLVPAGPVGKGQGR